MQNILEINNLEKEYPEVKAVDGISFAIEAGKCFGLLGPNGAGKTTTIEIIEGIISQTSGEVLYKGRERGVGFRQEVGIQLQNTELPLFLTVRETLNTFRKLYGKRAKFDYLVELCRLDDILDRDNQKISGGQKQRLLLAMALANDPELIFLDEPTTGLDPQARRHLWEIVSGLKKERKTIVLTTHYMEEAQTLCDEIAIMDHGRIIARGTPDELLNKHCRGSSIILPAGDDIKKLEGMEWPLYEIENRYEIQTSELDRCIHSLIERGVSLTGISIRPQNLEDLFLKLTGHELRG